MNLREYLKNRKTSVYHLSKDSGVPYTTLNSICNGTAEIKACRVNTLLKICNALGVGLSDNEAVEFGNDFAGREVGHGP